MKKILVLMCVVGLTLNSFAQEAANKKVLAGITLGSGLNFNKPQTNAINANVGGDFFAGMLLDWNFSKNIGLSTGIEFDFNRFKTSFKDSIYFNYDDKEILRKKDLEKLNSGDTLSFLLSERTHKEIYLTIPLMLKFQTNYMGYFRYFGKFGLRNNFLLSTRLNNIGESFDADGNATGVQEITDMRSSRLMSFYKGEIGIVGGAEYNIVGSTVLLAEIGYYYGFSEVFRQEALGKDKEKNMSLYRNTDKTGDIREYYAPKLRQGVLMLKIAVLF